MVVFSVKMDTKSITNDTELVCALDNVLWVEDLVQYMVKNGSQIPIVDLLKVIEKVHPQKYNEIQAKLEHVLSQELEKWDESKIQELKTQIKNTIIPIDYVFQTTTDKHGNKIKNISWTSNKTFGCSYGHFVLVIGRYKYQSRKRFQHFFVTSLEEFGKITSGDGYITLHNGCHFRSDRDDEYGTNRELEQLATIMKQTKCSCATGHPKLDGYGEIDHHAWFDVLQQIGEACKQNRNK